MVTIASLWLAIVLASVLVFIASAIIWTVMPHHKSDFKSLPDETAARKALTPQDIPPGQYNIPNIASHDALKDPEVVKLFTDGPVGFLTVVPKGVPSMGKNMVQSLVFYLLVSGTIAYLASLSLTPTAEYWEVFRFVGTFAWAAYGFAIVPDAIWFGRPWRSVGKHLVDAFVYAALTAGAFAWFWPG